MDFQSVISTIVFPISWVFAFIYGYFFYRILCLLLPVKENRLLRLAAYLSCIPLSIMVIYPNDMFNITLEFFWFLALVLIAFRGSLSRKFAAIAILYPLVIAFNFLTMDIFTEIVVNISQNFWIDPALALLDGALHLIFWLLILRFFEKYLQQVGSLFDNKTWLLLCAICTASLVSITTCIFFSPVDAAYRFWPCAFSCITTNIGSLYLSKYFCTSIQQNMERKNLKLQEEYYRELEANQTEIRRFRHDMNNHLGVIKALFSSASQKEAEAYFDKLEAQMAASNRVFCKNGIVNAVLNAKYNKAVENEIDCFFHIDLSHTPGIDDISLCTLFANTLDNAIEASLKIPDVKDRHISVKARSMENGYFSYEITNTKNNPIVKKHGIYITDKDNPSAHGIGLSNVREMAAKYGGTLEISHTDTTFTVTLFIKDAC